MIDARKLAGVTNTSSYQVYRSSKDYYANVVTGTNGKLLVVVGKQDNEYRKHKVFQALPRDKHWQPMCPYG